MGQSNRVRTAFGVFAWLVLVMNVSVSWLTSAQQGGAAPARGAAPAAPAEAPNFTGKTASRDASNVSASRRYFEAGARSNWHAHPNGQLILNESGTGLHQIQGKPIVRLAPGESAYVGPGVVHWHGAAPDAPLMQLSIGFGGSTNWGEPVPDAVYRGGSR